MIRARRGANGRRYQWRVRLKGLPERYGTCPTRACAVECARKAEEELRRGRPIGMPLEELAERYTSEHLPTIPDSAPMYSRHLEEWKRELGAVPVEALTARQVAEALARIAARPGRLGPRSPATLNRHLNTLSSVFRWATRPDVGLASDNPVRGVRRAKEAPRLRWLSRPVDGPRSELERLLEACRLSESPILLDVVLLLLSTGCRASEVLGLRRSEVRLAEGGFWLAPERSKTSTPRFVPLTGAAVDVVRRRLEQVEGGEHLFPGPAGAAGFPWRAWRTALRRSGVVNLRPHDLRHTHGSYLAMLGATLPEIMHALGHRSPQSAMRYVHLADQHKVRVSERLASSMSGWLAEGGARPAGAKPGDEAGFVDPHPAAGAEEGGG